MAFENVKIRSTAHSVTVDGFRQDLVAGETVTLSLTDVTGVTSFRWEILGRPEGSSAGGAGPEPILLGIGSSALFVVDTDAGFRKDGSYQIACTVNIGTPTEKRITAPLARLASITTVDGRALRKLGALEGFFDDTSVVATLQGWATQANRWLDKIIEVAGISGSVGTLNTVYGNGAVSADQTLNLLDTKGGGLIVNGSAGGFSGTTSFSVLGAGGSGVFVNRSNSYVGINQPAPQQPLHVAGAIRLEAGSPFDLVPGGSSLDVKIGASVLAQFFAAGVRTDLGVGINTTAPGAAVVAFGAGSTAPVSSAGTGRFRYNESTNRLQFSENGGAYVDVLQAASVTGGPFTAGSVIFATGATTLGQDNANFFFDDTNNRLGLGTSTPAVLLHLSGSAADIAERIVNTSTTGRGLIDIRGDGASGFSLYQTGSAWAGTEGVNSANIANVLAARINVMTTNTRKFRFQDSAFIIGGTSASTAAVPVLVMDAWTGASPVSAAGEGWIRYDSGTNSFQKSENGGAWTSLTGTGGGGAPVSAQYLVLALDGTLTDERRFVNGSGLSAVDGGAGGNYTLTNTLVTGLAGSQVVIGGTAASETLTLRSTSNATRGPVIVDASQLHVPAGTVSLPGAAFVSDTDTGVYLDAADSLSVSAGGAQVIRATGGSSGNLLLRSTQTGSSSSADVTITTTNSRTAGTLLNVQNAGTAYFEVATISASARQVRAKGRTDGALGEANPAYSFVDDPDTGIHWASGTTNTFYMVAGGAAWMSVSTLTVTMLNSAVLLHTLGSVSAPSISFFGDANTGIYSPAADQVAITTGGSQAALFTTTQAAFRDGTVSAPAIAFAAALTTGIYRSGSQLRVSVTGIDSLYVDTQQTQVRPGNELAPGLAFLSDADTGVYRVSADTLGFATGGSSVGSVGSAWELRSKLAAGSTATDFILATGVTRTSASGTHTSFRNNAQEVAAFLSDGSLIINQDTSIVTGGARHSLITATYFAGISGLTGSSSLYTAYFSGPTAAWTDGVTIAANHTYYFGAGTYTSSTAKTITEAATMYISGPPLGGGSGPLTINLAYALWVDEGTVRLDGASGGPGYVFQFPVNAVDPTGGGGAAAGRIPCLIGGTTRYLAYY